jgi:hypothetical protein
MRINFPTLRQVALGGVIAIFDGVFHHALEPSRQARISTSSQIENLRSSVQISRIAGRE